MYRRFDGCRLLYSYITGEVKGGKDYEPVAINSCFGWILCGYYEQPSVTTNFVNSAHMLLKTRKTPLMII